MIKKFPVDGSTQLSILASIPIHRDQNQKSKTIADRLTNSSHFFRAVKFFPSAFIQINFMLLLALAVLAGAQTFMFSINNQFPVVSLPSFGFEAGGTFNISIVSRYAPYSRFILVRQTRSEFANSILMKQIPDICATEATNNSQIVLNFGDSWRRTVSGVVQNSGVYSAFIVNCHANASRLTVSGHFRNPASLLDTRDMAIETVYRVLGWLYLGMFVAWAANGLWFSGFRVPLHTVFTIMPAIRFMESLFVEAIWRARATSDAVTGKEVPLAVLDLLYYASYLCAMAFVGTGWCIFRQMITRRLVIEVVVSSLATTLGVIMMRQVSCILGFVACLMLAGVGAIAYCKLIFVEVIILRRLLDELKETQVKMKIRLAWDYLVKNFVTTIIAVVSAGIMISLQVRTVAVMIVFEAIFVIGSLQQMKCFMFRKKYQSKDTGKDISPRERPGLAVMVLHEPFGRSITVLRDL